MKNEKPHLLQTFDQLDVVDDDAQGDQFGYDENLEDGAASRRPRSQRRRKALRRQRRVAEQPVAPLARGHRTARIALARGHRPARIGLAHGHRGAASEITALPPPLPFSPEIVGKDETGDDQR